MMNRSPSEFSYQSYEMFVGGQGAPPDGRSGPDPEQKTSVKSEDVDSLLGGGNVGDSRVRVNGKVRKVRCCKQPSPGAQA